MSKRIQARRLENFAQTDLEARCREVGLDLRKTRNEEERDPMPAIGQRLDVPPHRPLAGGPVSGPAGHALLANRLAIHRPTDV